jgi:hypothetical protein
MRRTDLAVTPPEWQMADTDRETFAFDAQSPITAASVVLTRLDTMDVVGGPVTNGGPASGPIESVSINGTVVNVTVSGLTRTVTYELAVTFTGADGRRWTRTLDLACVA